MSTDYFESTDCYLVEYINPFANKLSNFTDSHCNTLQCLMLGLK